MKTNFELSPDELKEVVSIYVAKKYSGTKLQITGVTTTDTGSVRIEAELVQKERKPRAPREAKEKTTTKLKKA